VRSPQQIGHVLRFTMAASQPSSTRSIGHTVVLPTSLDDTNQFGTGVDRHDDSLCQVVLT